MNYREVMIGPNKYLRGSGVLQETGSYAQQLGKRVIIIGGKTALMVTRDQLTRSLADHRLDFEIFTFTGDVSENQMNYYAAKARAYDLVLGIGGGKAIDCSKGVADLCNLPFISIPTSAATCAAADSLIICYTDNGAPAGSFYSKKSPDLVVADSQIIAEAPPRLLASGIGDTISKWPETKYAARNLVRNAFINSTESLGKMAFDLLFSKGIAAIDAVKNRKVTLELEDIIDANLLLSGMIGNTAGHECRLAVAHCVHDGLVDLGLAKKYLHGEKVAYGTMVQSALCDDISDAFLREIIIFTKTIGLPVCLADFGISEDDSIVCQIAKASQRDRLQSGPTLTSVNTIEAAIRKVNSIAKQI
jgi:glycerol dehydrogenase